MTARVIGVATYQQSLLLTLQKKLFLHKATDGLHLTKTTTHTKQAPTDNMGRFAGQQNVSVCVYHLGEKVRSYYHQFAGKGARVVTTDVCPSAFNKKTKLLL